MKGTIIHILDLVSKRSFGRTLTESREQGICVVCGKKIVRFRDPDSKEVSGHSQMCQQCQDNSEGRDETGKVKPEFRCPDFFEDEEELC